MLYKRTGECENIILQRAATRTYNKKDGQNDYTERGLPYKLTQRYNPRADRIVGINRRIGVPGIKRTLPKRPNGRPRNVPNFAQIEALDVERNGIRVQFGPDHLKKQYDVEVPDPRDIEWLDEYARMKKEYEDLGRSPTDVKRLLASILPLGRDQWTYSAKRTLLGDMSLKHKITEIKEEIDSGRAVSVKERAALMVVLTKMATKVEEMTTRELETFADSAVHLGAAKLSTFGSARYIGKDYFNKNEGLITMVIYARARMLGVPNLNSPIKNVQGSSTAYLKLSSFLTTLRSNDPTIKRYLDLVDLQAMREEEVRFLIDNGEVPLDQVAVEDYMTEAVRGEDEDEIEEKKLDILISTATPDKRSDPRGPGTSDRKKKKKKPKRIGPPIETIPVTPTPEKRRSRSKRGR